MNRFASNGLIVTEVSESRCVVIWSLVLSAAVLLAAACPAVAQILPAAKYEGTWEIQPNGDVKVTRKFQLPMQLYRMWKEADVHMLEARSFAAERSNVEVPEKKAEWDDLNRTLTLTMTVQGLASNMATHWEAKMLAGEEFSNLDEAKKTAFFHFAAEGPMGRVQGQDIVVLPSDSSKLSWVPATRTITYVMPAPSGAGGGSAGLWWVLFALTAAGAAGLWATSMLIKPEAAADSPPTPPADR